MKTTVLICKDPSVEKGELIVATHDQWDSILKKNRTLPREQRRFFICDAFEDSGEIDRMFIEVSKKEYDKWHSDKVRIERNRKLEKQLDFISISQKVPDAELTFEDVIASDYDLELDAEDVLRLEQLRNNLAYWRKWADYMLNLYLAGLRKEATYIISEKFGVSIRTAQRWKDSFETFARNFFEKN